MMAAALLGAGPAQAAAPPPAVKVVVGGVDYRSGYTCALRAGAVSCVGTVARHAYGATPVRVPLPGKVVDLAGGEDHVCAVLADGRALCWGAGSTGELGNGAHPVEAATPVPVALPRGGHARTVADAGGSEGTCASLTDGSVWCWGRGHLGNGRAGGSATPVRVLLPAGRRVAAIAGGAETRCAVFVDGGAACWGMSYDGAEHATHQIFADTPVVLTLPRGRRIAALYPMSDQRCALMDDGSWTCWTGNHFGGLRNGEFAAPPEPGKVPRGRHVVGLLTIGDDNYPGADPTCTSYDDGSLRCTEVDEAEGLAGDGTESGVAGSSVLLPHGTRAVSGGTAQEHACAVLTSGRIVCWGADAVGQLGNGVAEPTGTYDVPTPVYSSL